MSAKIGNAVVRNRIRRLIKENFRILENIKSGYDIVIVARTVAAFSTYEEIGKDLKKALMETELKKG